MYQAIHLDMKTSEKNEVLNKFDRLKGYSIYIPRAKRVFYLFMRGQKISVSQFILENDLRNLSFEGTQAQI